MSETAFSKVLRGLKETQTFLKGRRQGYKVIMPPTIKKAGPSTSLRSTQDGEVTVGLSKSLDPCK